MTEGDEALRDLDAPHTLAVLYLLAKAGESMGVVAMYELAALRKGLTMDDTERAIKAGRMDT